MGRIFRHLILGLMILITTGTNLPQAFAQTPDNDDFDSALVVSSLPFSDSINTEDATTAIDDPVCAGSDHTVWYSFTPSEDIDLEANTFGSDYDTTLSVYTGSRDSLNQIDCNDDADSLQSQLIFRALADKTYFFMISSFPGTVGGNLVFNLDEGFIPPPPPPPPNDDFDNATVISVLPFTDNINVEGATAATDDPACADAGHTVWYSFTPDDDARLYVNTLGSDFETALGVYTGTRGNLVEIGCDVELFERSEITFDAIAGETYFFMVGAEFEPAQNLVFTLDVAFPPLPSPTKTQIVEADVQVHQSNECVTGIAGVFDLNEENCSNELTWTLSHILADTVEIKVNSKQLNDCATSVESEGSGDVDCSNTLRLELSEIFANKIEIRLDSDQTENCLDSLSSEASGSVSCSNEIILSCTQISAKAFKVKTKAEFVNLCSDSITTPDRDSGEKSKNQPGRKAVANMNIDAIQANKIEDKDSGQITQINPDGSIEQTAVINDNDTSRMNNTAFIIQSAQNEADKNGAASSIQNVLLKQQNDGLNNDVNSIVQNASGLSEGFQTATIDGRDNRSQSNHAFINQTTFNFASENAVASSYQNLPALASNEFLDNDIIRINQHESNSTTVVGNQDRSSQSNSLFATFDISHPVRPNDESLVEIDVSISQTNFIDGSEVIEEPGFAALRTTDDGPIEDKNEDTIEQIYPKAEKTKK